MRIELLLLVTDAVESLDGVEVIGVEGLVSVEGEVDDWIVDGEGVIELLLLAAESVIGCYFYVQILNII